MKTRQKKSWMHPILTSAAAGLVLAAGCGGGGGGGGTSGATIVGNLDKAAGMTVASRRVDSPLLASAASWLGVRPAFAAGTTSCGNPTDPASGVPVDLLLNGAVVQSTVTGSDGGFAFVNVVPGLSYVVRVALPSGAISSPTFAVNGATTTLKGAFDVDCHDADRDGDRREIELEVEQESEDGSHMASHQTRHGGEFEGEVRGDDGALHHQSGHDGDRGDQVDDHGGSSGQDDGGSSGGSLDDDSSGSGGADDNSTGSGGADDNSTGGSGGSGGGGADDGPNHT